MMLFQFKKTVFFSRQAEGKGCFHTFFESVDYRMALPLLQRAEEGVMEN